MQRFAKIYLAVIFTLICVIFLIAFHSNAFNLRFGFENISRRDTNFVLELLCMTVVFGLLAFPLLRNIVLLSQSRLVDAKLTRALVISITVFTAMLLFALFMP